MRRGLAVLLVLCAGILILASLIGLAVAAILLLSAWRHGAPAAAVLAALVLLATALSAAAARASVGWLLDLLVREEVRHAR